MRLAFIFKPARPLSQCSRAASSAAGEKTFDKIVIANRGEIACRVIKTARRMGIKTVAVYSEADSHALHVEMADEAICIGPPQSSASYLNVDAIMHAIKATGAQAVHPGYGFLSENFNFCKTLDDNGIVFIGPAVEAMAKMGDKIESKVIAKGAKVNTIPGFNGVVKDVEHAKKIASEIGYPIMLKASAGGGGKGMRIAWNEKDIAENFAIAAAESKASFGDDRLLVEKYIEEPRHIEVQILGDKHGNIVYLPERECSIQRRNQKVIEEAPSMAIDEETRRRMGAQAVQLAKKVGYYSAGTVEFLLDKHKQFYFLEMNTRLQVEHPITEYITGIDLVEQMIRVAAGHPLAIKQEEVKINGWAFESRIYAEDSKLFLPSIGRLHRYAEPTIPGDGDIRCDSGIKEGSQISIYYDPLICKLCTHGANRGAALSKMVTALDSYVIRGVTHNIPIIRKVFSQERFQKGQITTKYLAEEFPTGFAGHTPSLTERAKLCAAAVAVHAKQLQRLAGPAHYSAALTRDLVVTVGEAPPAAVSLAEDGTCLAVINGKAHTMQVAINWPVASPILSVAIDGQAVTMQYHGSPHTGKLLLQAWGTTFTITVESKLEHTLAKHMVVREQANSELVVRAPMAGQIVTVSAAVGEVVREGAELAVIEAMKMQNVLRAAKAGRVKAVHISPGTNVASDQVLIELEDV